eukprot:6830102-Prymnesium_polylepis.1
MNGGEDAMNEERSCSGARSNMGPDSSFAGGGGDESGQGGANGAGGATTKLRCDDHQGEGPSVTDVLTARRRVGLPVEAGGVKLPAAAAGGGERADGDGEPEADRYGGEWARDEGEWAGCGSR